MPSRRPRTTVNSKIDVFLNERRRNLLLVVERDANHNGGDLTREASVGVVIDHLSRRRCCERVIEGFCNLPIVFLMLTISSFCLPTCDLSNSATPILSWFHDA